MAATGVTPEIQGSDFDDVLMLTDQLGDRFARDTYCGLKLGGNRATECILVLGGEPPGLDDIVRQCCRLVRRSGASIAS